MELIHAKKIAEKNRNKLQTSFPSKLLTKEDKFLQRMERAKINASKKLESLYELMGELSSYVSSFTPCAKGCSSCCYYNVTISEIEIRHIENTTKWKRNKSLQQKKDFHNTPCPFLENNSCSIYESRPFVCRRHLHLSDTNYWCEPSRSNKDKFPLLGFTSVDGVYDLIRKESNSYDIVDIRQVFSNIHT